MRRSHQTFAVLFIVVTCSFGLGCSVDVSELGCNDAQTPSQKAWACSGVFAKIAIVSVLDGEKKVATTGTIAEALVHRKFKIIVEFINYPTLWEDDVELLREHEDMPLPNLQEAWDRADPRSRLDAVGQLRRTRTSSSVNLIERHLAIVGLQALAKVVGGDDLDQDSREFLSQFY